MSSLESRGILHAELCDKLTHGVGVSSAFSFHPSDHALKHVSRAHESSDMKAVQARINFSRAPMLLIFRLLYEEDEVKKTLEAYLGAWAPALRVVIASKPKKAMPVDGNDGDVVENMVENSSSSSPESHHHHRRRRRHRRRLTVVNHLSSSKLHAQNYYDELHRFINSQREVYITQLIELRSKQREERDLLSKYSRLKNFIEKPGNATVYDANIEESGADANRMLFDYWCERYELAYRRLVTDKEDSNNTTTESSKKNNGGTGRERRKSVAELEIFNSKRINAYVAQVTDLRKQYRKMSLNALQTFKEYQNKVAETKETLSTEAIQFFEKNLKNDKILSMIEVARHHPDTDGTTPLFPKKESSVILESLSKCVSEKEAHLKTVGTQLAMQRKEFNRKINQHMSRYAEKAMDLENSVEQSQVRKDKLNIILADIEQSLTTGTDAYYDQVMESMGRSAHLSLEHVDKNFIEAASIFDSDRGDLFDELLWKLDEKEWQYDVKNDIKSEFCHDLIVDLEKQLKENNKMVFQYEAKRVKRVKEYTDKKVRAVANKTQSTE